MHVVRVVRSFKVRLIRHPREIRFYRFSVTAMHSMIYLVSFAGKEKLLWLVELGARGSRNFEIDTSKRRKHVLRSHNETE